MHPAAPAGGRPSPAGRPSAVGGAVPEGSEPLVYNGGVRWKVRGASAQGGGHVDRGKPCQDSFDTETVVLRDERRDVDVPVYVIAVADGGGSRQRAAQGANVAVGLAVDRARVYLREHGLPPDPQAFKLALDELFDATRQDFLHFVEEYSKRAASDFATTLMIVIIVEEMVGFAAVGDGFVVVRDRGGDLHALHSEVPDSVGGESGGTTFLTSSDAKVKLRASIHVTAPNRRMTPKSDITGVLVSTDGMASALLDDKGPGQPREPNPEAVADVMELLGDSPSATDAQLLAFLVSPEVAPHTRDDKTVLLAVRP